MKLRIFAALFAAALLAVAPAAQAQKLKLGTLAPKGSPWYDILQDMAAAWGAESGGKIKVRIYPGGSIGDETDMLRKMLVGQLQGAVLTSEGLGRIVPELRVLQLPMWYRSDAELDYVRAALTGEMEALFEKRGFKVLNWGDIGWIRLFTREPAPGPDGLAAQKLFCWSGDNTICDAWKRQGFTPVPLAMTDIFSGLQSGLIDAVFTAPVPALAYQWFGMATHMTDIKVVKMFGATVVTLKAWNRIPEDIRPQILAAAHKAGKESEQRIRAVEAESIAVMQQHGLTVHTPPPALMKAWEARSRDADPVLLNDSVPQELVARAEALREEFRTRVGQN